MRSHHKDAILGSNKVFKTFKQEIGKMAKSIKELKQENMFLKRKCETSDIIRTELLKWLVGLHVQVFILSFVNNKSITMSFQYITRQFFIRWTIPGFLVALFILLYGRRFNLYHIVSCCFLFCLGSMAHDNLLTVSIKSLPCFRFTNLL